MAAILIEIKPKWGRMNRLNLAFRKTHLGCGQPVVRKFTIIANGARLNNVNNPPILANLHNSKWFISTDVEKLLKKVWSEFVKSIDFPTFAVLNFYASWLEYVR